MKLHDTKTFIKKINRTIIVIILIESCFCCFASWIQHSMCFFDLQECHPTFLLRFNHYDLNIKIDLLS
jgi:hypothetical protein